MQPIVVRERRDPWLGLAWVAFSLAVFVYCAFVHRSPTPALWAGVFTSVMAAPGLWYVVTGWSTLTADDDGIRRRDLRGTQHVLWADIRDFYVREIGLIGDVVELDDRRTSTWRSDHPRAEALRTAVLARATRAPAREWGPLGGRTVEPLPWTFDYPAPPAIRGDVVITLGVTVVGGALFAVEFARVGAALFHPPYLNGTLLKIAMLLACPIGLSLPSMQAARDQRRRSNQRVIAREEGLRYEDRSRDFEVTWGEIVRVVPSGSVGNVVQLQVVKIESRRGSFDVTNGIADCDRLMQLIAYRAPQALDAWRHAESQREDLLPPTTQPGVKVHHYRTRPERNVLCGFGAFLALALGLSLWHHHLKDAFLVALFFGIPFALLLLLHLSVRVTTDEGGITYERFGKTDSLTWSELTVWRPAGGDAFAHLLIEGRGQRWRIGAGISDGRGLIETLEAHRPTTPGPTLKS